MIMRCVMTRCACGGARAAAMVKCRDDACVARDVADGPAGMYCVCVDVSCALQFG